MTITQLHQAVEKLVKRPLPICRQRKCFPLRIASTLIAGTTQADLEIVHIDRTEVTTVSRFSVNYTGMTTQDLLALIEHESRSGRGWHQDIHD